MDTPTTDYAAALLDIAARIRRVPVNYGLDGHDVDQLREIAEYFRSLEALDHMRSVISCVEKMDLIKETLEGGSK